MPDRYSPASSSRSYPSKVACGRSPGKGGHRAAHPVRLQGLVGRGAGQTAGARLLAEQSEGTETDRAGRVIVEFGGFVAWLA